MVKKLLLIIIGIVVLPVSASANLIYDPGFEISSLGPIPTGFPTDYGVWAYDPVTVVNTENSITPLEGSQMVRFDRTSPYGAATARGSDLYQYIDLGTSTSSDTTAYASAYFNRVAGDVQTDNEFYLYVYGYTGDLTGTHASTGVWSSSIRTDASTETWQQILFPVTLPVGTDYVAIRLTARENIWDDAGSPEWPEFDGHYADNIYFGFSEPMTAAPVPEPATMLLLGSGMAGLAFARKRFRKA